MPMDTEVADLMKANLVKSSQLQSELNHTVAQNLVQGLGVVNSSIIQQQGSVSDDSGLIAALQTASTSPKQGAIGAGA